VRTLRQRSGNIGFDPTHLSSAQGSPTTTCTTERPGALGPSRRAEWFSLSLRERDGVRGKGLVCRLRLSFQPLAPVSIPSKIARNPQRSCLRILCRHFLRTFSTKMLMNAHATVCGSASIPAAIHENVAREENHHLPARQIRAELGALASAKRNAGRVRVSQRIR
jgi:hypothetical protein